MTSEIKKRQTASYCIDNAEIWTEAGVLSGRRIWVENGRLKAMGDFAIPAGIEVIDVNGSVVMPSGVDAQTHLRVPGQAHKEKPETGLRAALKGGYSAVLTMPNTQPTIDNLNTLKQGQEEIRPYEAEFGIHVFWSAAITKRLNSDEPTEFEELVRAGVRAFTNDGLGVLSDQVMEQAFKKLEATRVPLLQHAEFLGHGGSMAPGPVQEKIGATPYPDEPEWKMVERDLRELRKHPNARYHVLHVSSRRTLDLVRQAKSEGLNVTAEVTPHHLYFNTETIDPKNTSFKMNPPIRSSADQRALWEGLVRGDVDFVATDHAPHEDTMKVGAFDKVAFGTLGLETTLPVLIDAWKRGVLSVQRLVEVFATKPADFLRLPSGFGRWVIDAPFHATCVDVHAPARAFTPNDFASLSKNSCFIGSQLPGRIRRVFHENRIFELM